MITEQNEEYTIRAKTGWTRENNINTGWWTGYIETKMGLIFCNKTFTRQKNEKVRFRKLQKRNYQKVFKDLNII